MERPIPYKGDQSYIFISYAHRDSALVWPIVDRMQKDGYRVWYDEGIDPGTEWDENIAAHVTGCSFFIAFLSEHYLASDNCKDELNFARDQGKQRILIYLEDVELPQGMAMRLGRSQAIFYDRYADKNKFYEKLYEAQGIDAFGPGAGSDGVKKAEPAKVQTVSQAQKKKSRPGWVLPVALLAAVAVIIGLVFALKGLGGERQAPGGDASAGQSTSMADGVLVDTEEMRISVVGQTSDSRYYGLDVLVENKTDREISVSLYSSYLNGLLCDTSWYVYVEGGSTAQETIQWSWDTLNAGGVEEVTAIECQVQGYYCDDYSDLPTASAVYYPLGEENADYVVYTPGSEDLVLVDDEGCLVAVTGWGYSELDAFYVDVVTVNQSDRGMGVSAEECFVNGYAMDPLWLVHLEPGKLAYTRMSWTGWEDTGEAGVLVLDGMLEVYDRETYDTWLTQPFLLYPEGEENAVLTPWTMGADDLVVLENEHVQVVLTEMVEDYGDFKLCFYVRNLSEKTINVSLRSIGAEGFEGNGCYLPTLPAGSQCIQTAWLYREEGETPPLEAISLTIDVENTQYDQVCYETVTVELN